MRFRFLPKKFGTYIWIISNLISVLADETTCSDEDYCIASSNKRYIPDSECVDLHSLCREWANEGECLLNPEYMKAACKYSCLLCVNENSRKNDGLNEVQM